MTITSSPMDGKTGLRTLMKAGLKSFKDYIRDSYEIASSHPPLGGLLLGGVPAATAISILGMNYTVENFSDPTDFTIKTLSTASVACIAGFLSSKMATEGINLLHSRSVINKEESIKAQAIDNLDDSSKIKEPNEKKQKEIKTQSVGGLGD